MIASYVWRDLTRNPRRSLATLAGITLGVGLFSAVLFFIDGSSASMTQRAIAPLPIDMQRLLTAPLGAEIRLTERVTPAAPLQPGQTARVELVLANRGRQPANEVVIRDEPPAPLAYVPGSTTIDGARVPDPAGDSPLAQGAAKLGLNLGTVAPRTSVTVAYSATATAAVDPGRPLALHATFSSREIVAPVQANAPGPAGLAELTRRIAAAPGVATADQLSFVDLAPGSLQAGANKAAGAVRVFGFDHRYRQHHDAIRIVGGSQRPGQGLLSAEAARALSVRPGDAVRVRVPGLGRPLSVPISGITDLTRARSLFYSRQGQQLEQFLYLPNTVVLDPEVFARTIVPAFQTATTAGGDLVKSKPIREVDIAVERERLDADPATALAQTRAVAGAVTQIAPGQDELIDNVSNTLQVARDDARVAKRMFVFLGVPGALLAAILAAYAGGVLASALRREQAILRIRGANRRHLLRMHALRTLVLAAAGSVVGLGLGMVSAIAVLSTEALASASTASLVASALLGAGGGFLATGAALYAAGRRAINQDISEERAQLSSRPPAWRRLRLDLAALLAVAAAELVALRTGAFEGAAGSVYNGRSVSIRLHLLVAPIGVWIAGVLLLARVAERLFSHLPLPSPPQFGRPLRGILTRSLRRRSWAAAGGVIIVALIVALGTSVASFTASYNRAKAADARFVVGSDVRVTPGPTSTVEHPPAAADTLAVPGVQAATPVVFALQNAVVQSRFNEDAANLAAVDPATFGRVAALADANFVDRTAAGAMAALQRDAGGVLVSVELADHLALGPGDPVEVLFARGTPEQKLSNMTVIGLFERLPGFPEGADVLANLERQVDLIPATNASFFLARTSDPAPATLHRVVAALRAGPGSVDTLQIDTRETALDKDQSSLAALNIHGLLTLDAAYALAMAATAIAVFVFGLLLQRRREYVTLRAQGMHAGEIRALLVMEAGGVVVGGAVAGLLVGGGMAIFLVSVLRPLFVLRPPIVVPAAELARLTALVLGVSLLASLAATTLVNRLPPTELLREE
jgi:putative ABC transport system permease protein